MDNDQKTHLILFLLNVNVVRLNCIDMADKEESKVEVGCMCIGLVVGLLRLRGNGCKGLVSFIILDSMGLGCSFYNLTNYCL